MEEKIYRSILAAQNILLISHKRPDHDTVSSACAMAEFLSGLNKNYRLFCQDKIPAEFYFLFHSREFKTTINFDLFDLIICLDCGNLDRTGLAKEILSKKTGQTIINFDHHIKIDDFADLEIKKENACATAELIYDFFEKNNIKINKPMAECILTGILADSGHFLFSRTNAKNLAIASRMLLAGANWAKINRKLNNNKKLEALRAWGEAFSRLKINKTHNFAATILTSKDLNNLEEEDTAGLPEFLSALADVKGIAILKEREQGLISANLRSSHPSAKMDLLANIFSGGGNNKTAGFTVAGQINQINNHYKII